MSLSRLDFVFIVVILLLLLLLVYKHLVVTKDPGENDKSLGLNELIKKVRSELILMENDRIKENQGGMFELKDFDLEIKFTVNEKRTLSGKIEYQVITIGSEKEISTEKVQTIKLHMKALGASNGEVSPSKPNE